MQKAKQVTPVRINIGIEKNGKLVCATYVEQEKKGKCGEEVVPGNLCVLSNLSILALREHLGVHGGKNLNLTRLRSTENMSS